MSISLPDELKDFVNYQVDSGRHSSVSEYVCENAHLGESSSCPFEPG